MANLPVQMPAVAFVPMSGSHCDRAGRRKQCPLIGWETSAAFNAQGRELASFENMQLRASVTDVGE